MCVAQCCATPQKQQRLWRRDLLILESINWTIIAKKWDSTNKPATTPHSPPTTLTMENFTDIFGEDLAGLEDLGNLGNFAGSAGGEMDANAQQQQQQPQQQQQQQSGMDQGLQSSSQYSQQQFQPHPGGGGGQKMPGYGDYGSAGAAYRPGAPSQYGYANGPSPHGPPGYPPNPGNLQTGKYKHSNLVCPSLRHIDVLKSR